MTINAKASALHADLAQARQWLAQARHVAVLTGAGVSAESGVPTFGGVQGGLWQDFDPVVMSSEDGFRSNPQLVWQWYAQRRHNLQAQAQPNAGHVALARYAQQHPGKLTLITQNVDALHQRAGSTQVVALHGELMANRWLDAPCPQCDEAAALAAGAQPPQCPACGNCLRPAVVWFGEHLPADALATAEAAAHACDVMLVVGTSGEVYPAAGLAFQAHERGAKVVIVNPEATALDMIADARLVGPSATVLPQLLGAQV